MKPHATYIAALAGAVLLFGSAHAQHDERAADKSRAELSAMAEKAVQDLVQKNEIADTLYDDAYGYAVFDTTKGGLIVTGVGGTGLAQTKNEDQKVVMHLGGAGIGLGAGLENYKLVLLIQNQDTYEQFTNGQWNGSIGASAAAGEAGVSAVEQFVNGVAAFRMTEGGLIALTDITAMRFWPSDRMNDDHG